MAIYFSISRKRETRRVFLTPRLNLQFYYIPVVTEQPNTMAVTVSLGSAALGAAAGCQQLTVFLEEEQGGLQEFTSINASLLEQGGWEARQGSLAQFAGWIQESINPKRHSGCFNHPDG